jgi:hypothetical protein
MARATQHAAMIVWAATYWETPISTMIQDFGHFSPSQGALPTFQWADTPIPLPIPPPQEVIHVTIPPQPNSPIYIPASPTELSYSPTPNPITEIIQTFLAEAEDNATPPPSPSAIPLPVYQSPTLWNLSPPTYENNDPQPGIHPGFLWNGNLEGGEAKFPQFCVYDGDKQFTAPFYCINMDDKYPTVSVTEGCNCLIQSLPLHVQPHPYPRLLLTQKEEFLFCNGECFTPLINEALHMEGDITLRAEVTRYRWATAEVYSLTHQLTSLKRKFDDATWEVHDSRKRLAMADAYGCLKPHVLYGVQAGGDITADDVQHGIDQIMDL